MVVQGRVLNWRPSLKDANDKQYKHIELAVPRLILPASMDLRPKCSPVMDQLQMGSCSGNATAGAVEFLELQELPLPGAQPQEYVPGKFDPVSRLFIYWNERALEGTTGQDAGATTLRDACVAVQSKGVPRESTWPYLQSNLLRCPTSQAYGEAYHHKVPFFYELSDLTELKRCLANGFPHLFGIPVYSSFLSQQAAMTGIIPMPGGRGDTIQGGHALLCVGYDDMNQWFIFRNSWGVSWGQAGYGFLPYAYMEMYADDFYTLRRLPATSGAKKPATVPTAQLPQAA